MTETTKARPVIQSHETTLRARAAALVGAALMISSCVVGAGGEHVQPSDLHATSRTSAGAAAACAGCPDFNHDGVIDRMDTDLFVNCVFSNLSCTPAYDLNGDGFVSMVGDLPCFTAFTLVPRTPIADVAQCAPLPPDPSGCAGDVDFDGDGTVGAGDLHAFEACVYWGRSCTPAYDLNGDGMITIVGDVPCFAELAGIGEGVTRVSEGQQ